MKRRFGNRYSVEVMNPRMLSDSNWISLSKLGYVSPWFTGDLKQAIARAKLICLNSRSPVVVWCHNNQFKEIDEREGQLHLLVTTLFNGKGITYQHFT